MVELRIYKVVSSIFFKLVICQSSVLVARYTFSPDDWLNEHTCLHRALEDKTVGSVNADIGVESCAVGQDHLSSFTGMS